MAIYHLHLSGLEKFLQSSVAILCSEDDLDLFLEYLVGKMFHALFPCIAS